jgi:hypothetical protein
VQLKLDTVTIQFGFRIAAHQLRRPTTAEPQLTLASPNETPPGLTELPVLANKCAIDARS